MTVIRTLVTDSVRLIGQGSFAKKPWVNVIPVPCEWIIHHSKRGEHCGQRLLDR